ncbi:DUF3310 domain-containing protein [Macrococcus brunensis]|uniref:DUF3310 domain-containing protein n=1 Tax=Macrococcus brunensis TaxID=198483 RepID=UPI001EF06D71|nr:DUF3310 domain-containing protein [Macrococcus brunensis]ULG73002.1 DUF3310 domain-containing protein [Macrococcus brunensis]
MKAKKPGLMMGYTIEEVERAIHEEDGIQGAARKLKVNYQNIYRFKKKYKKEFNQLSAQREQGLVIEEEKVVKTVPVKTMEAAGEHFEDFDDEDGEEVEETLEDLKEERKSLKMTIAQLRIQMESDQVVIEDQARLIQRGDKGSEKELEELKKKYKYLSNNMNRKEQTIEKLREEVKQLQAKETTGHSIVTLEKKHQAELQHQQKKFDERLKELESAGNDMESVQNKLKQERLKVSELEKMLAGHKDTIDKAAKTNKILSEEVDSRGETIKQLQDALKQSEESFRDATIEYEDIIKEQQEQIAELEKNQMPKLTDIINGTTTDRVSGIERKVDGLVREQLPVQVIDDSEMKVTPLNPPAHYASDGGIDPIAFLEMHGTSEEVRGAFKINVLKYSARLGRKDAEVKEVDKIIDYAQRYKKYLESKEGQDVVTE